MDKSVNEMAVWSDDATDYKRAYESMCKKSHSDNETIGDLKARLSHVMTNAAIGQALAFFVGTICGYGVSYVW